MGNSLTVLIGSVISGGFGLHQDAGSLSQPLIIIKEYATP